MKEGFFETCFIDVKTDHKRIIYGSIYRPPENDLFAHSVFISNLKKTLQTLVNLKRPCYLMGDANYDMLELTNIHV